MLPEGVFRGPVELSYKVLSVEEAVGGGFGEVFWTDVGGSGQVSDGAGQSDDAGAGSGGESHAFYEALQQCLAVCGQGTEQLGLAVVHGGVAEDILACFRKPRPLNLTSLQDTCRYLRTGLPGLPVHQHACIDPGNHQLYVDPVHNRAGQFG